MLLSSWYESRCMGQPLSQGCGAGGSADGGGGVLVRLLWPEHLLRGQNCARAPTKLQSCRHCSSRCKQTLSCCSLNVLAGRVSQHSVGAMKMCCATWTSLLMLAIEAKCTHKSKVCFHVLSHKPFSAVSATFTPAVVALQTALLVF